MAFKKILLSIVLLGFSLTTYAEVGTNTAPISETSKSPLSLTASLEIPNHSFLIATDAGHVDQHQVSQRIQYNPTFGPNVGVHAEYQKFSFGLSKRLYFNSPNDEKKYGKTDYDDYRIAYEYSPYLSTEIYYQGYRGFYTDLNGREGLQTSFSSSQNSQQTPAGESVIVNRSDINTHNYGLRAFMALPLNKILSVFSSKKESSLNWDFNLLGKIYYNHLDIVGDQALVPDAMVNAFSPISSLKEFSANTLGVGLGLGFVLYATTESTFGFSALAGPGFQRQSNIYIDRDEVNYTTATELNSNLYYDWKGPQHGFRGGFYLDSLTAKVKDINFGSTNLGINVAYTYAGLQF